MRTYIHIHLSINLMVAQIIFVGGVDQTSDIVRHHYARDKDAHMGWISYYQALLSGI